MRPVYILIVEDHQAVREAMTDGLTRAGFTVRGASTIEEARTLLFTDKLPFTAIALDHKIGSDNTETFVREVRESGFTGLILGMSLEMELSIRIERAAYQAGGEGHTLSVEKLEAVDVLRKILAPCQDE
ncbi:MAG: response regulator [Candidatus Paceibacterota bacterium]